MQLKACVPDPDDAVVGADPPDRFGGGMNGKRKNPLTFTPAKTVDDEQRLAKRQRRFESGTATPTMTNGVRDLSIASDSSAVDEEYIKVRSALWEDRARLIVEQNIPGYDKHTLIGRSQKLEKPYLRLTSYPNPDEIRPLDVCKRALDHIKKKWRSEGNYNWVCDQFKSLRQDLTVRPPRFLGSLGLSARRRSSA